MRGPLVRVTVHKYMWEFRFALIDHNDGVGVVSLPVHHHMYKWLYLHISVWVVGEGVGPRSAAVLYFLLESSRDDCSDLPLFLSVLPIKAVSVSQRYGLTTIGWVVLLHTRSGNPHPMCQQIPSTSPAPLPS